MKRFVIFLVAAFTLVRLGEYTLYAGPLSEKAKQYQWEQVKQKPIPSDSLRLSVDQNRIWHSEKGETIGGDEALEKRILSSKVKSIFFMVPSKAMHVDDSEFSLADLCSKHGVILYVFVPTNAIDSLLYGGQMVNTYRLKRKPKPSQ